MNDSTPVLHKLVVQSRTRYALILSVGQEDMKLLEQIGKAANRLKQHTLAARIQQALDAEHMLARSGR